MLEIIEGEHFSKWERGLDEVTRFIIATRVARLAIGLPGDTKFVGGRVCEMRIHYGPGIRIYYTMHGRRLILLLHGGDKSSQTKDIALAKRLAASGEF